MPSGPLPALSDLGPLTVWPSFPRRPAASPWHSTSSNRSAPNPSPRRLASPYRPTPIPSLFSHPLLTIQPPPRTVQPPHHAIRPPPRTIRYSFLHRPALLPVPSSPFLVSFGPHPLIVRPSSPRHPTSSHHPAPSLHSPILLPSPSDPSSHAVRSIPCIVWPPLVVQPPFLTIRPPPHTIQALSPCHPGLFPMPSGLLLASCRSLPAPSKTPRTVQPPPHAMPAVRSLHRPASSSCHATPSPHLLGLLPMLSGLLLMPCRPLLVTFDPLPILVFFGAAPRCLAIISQQPNRASIFLFLLGPYGWWDEY